MLTVQMLNLQIHFFFCTAALYVLSIDALSPDQPPRLSQGWAIQPKNGIAIFIRIDITLCFFFLQES